MAALTPLMILSLQPACFAGNEPAQAPTSNAQPKGRVLDRPEMAPFKRFQGFAIKYRQRLSNMVTMLEQAKRVGTISPATYKNLRGRLDHFLEMEPGLARNNWNQTEVEAFEKQLDQYNKDFAAGDANEKAPAQSKSAQTEKAKTEPSKPGKPTAKSETPVSKTEKPGASKK